MKAIPHLCRPLIACALAGGLLAGSAGAEIFVLHDGGRVRGELVNRDESPRKTYVIKTSGGGQVTLDAAQVKDVKRQSAAEMQYDRIRADYADSVDGQWKLAEWCRENRLVTQRKVHLQRIIELEPDHAAARHALGYAESHGRWVTRDTLMAENGYVRYKGQWLLPQELEIQEQQRKDRQAQAEWAEKLKRWNGWLHTDKAGVAEANIKAIDDPYAAKALAKHFDTEQLRAIRMLYVEALGRLKPGGGMETLVDASLYDGDEEIRIACLDQVVANDYKPAVRHYVAALRSKDNAIINRAGYCLGRMKDKSAIPPLIDSLVTIHSFTIQKGSPGGIAPSFGKGPGGSFGGLSVGSSTETISQRAENQGVLQALVELTGVSFNFDGHAWKNWYAAQKKPQSLDARRDDSPR